MNLELKRKKLELARVQMARNELEFKIEEKLHEIERLKDAISAQENKEKELVQEISNLTK